MGKVGWINFKGKIDDLNSKIEQFHTEEVGNARKLTGIKMFGARRVVKKIEQFHTEEVRYTGRLTGIKMFGSRTGVMKERTEQHRFIQFAESESGLKEDRRVLTPCYQARYLKLVFRYLKCLHQN